MAATAAWAEATSANLTGARRGRSRAVMRRTALMLLLLAPAACMDAPPPGGPAPAGDSAARAGLPADPLERGHVLMAQGDYEAAFKAYSTAAGTGGLTADALSGMGSASLKLGRLTEARRLLEAAVERDPRFVAAWNNLGVVLMEMGEIDAARRVFRTAFALDSGKSEEIRRNLQLALAKSRKTAYSAPNDNRFGLVRRGEGRVLLLRTPDPAIGQ